MIGLDEIRAFAMALPDVQEGPPVPAARRLAAFKVGGESFVGLQKGLETMTVSVGEAEAKDVVARQPDAYEETGETERPSWYSAWICLKSPRVACQADNTSRTFVRGSAGPNGTSAPRLKTRVRIRTDPNVKRR